MALPKTTRHPLTSYQPIRLIYRFFKITTVLAKVPFWLLRALFPALRQHPKWTFKQSIFANLAKTHCELMGTIAITEPLSLKPGKQGDRWVVVGPFDNEIYVGPLLSELVRPGEVGGTWYPVFPPGLRGEDGEASARPTKVALHIHGGGFVLYNGRDDNTGYLGRRYVEKAGFDAVFVPQYRLAGHGGRDPFPAALQDALTSYLYLVRALGIPAEAVTVSGDSAGGNLAVALLRYLEAFGDQLGIPRPGHAVLVSPWTAPLEALTVDYARSPEARTDFLPTSLLEWGATAYALQSDRIEDSRVYINPLGHPFRTSVSVFLTIGTAEILRAQGAKWVDEMRGVEGNRVEVNFEDAAPHDTLFLGGSSGWGENASVVARKIGAFVDEQ